MVFPGNLPMSSLDLNHRLWGAHFGEVIAPSTRNRRRSTCERLRSPWEIYTEQKHDKWKYTYIHIWNIWKNGKVGFNRFEG